MQTPVRNTGPGQWAEVNHTYTVVVVRTLGHIPHFLPHPPPPASHIHTTMACQPQIRISFRFMKRKAAGRAGGRTAENNKSPRDRPISQVKAGERRKLSKCRRRRRSGLAFEPARCRKGDCFPSSQLETCLKIFIFRLLILEIYMDF